MAEPIPPLANQFITDLNLDPVATNVFIGHLDRVPFKLELICNSQTIGLLFQSRFSKVKQDMPENLPLVSGSLLEALVMEKKAEISIENSTVWFNLFAAHELIESGTLLQVIHEFTAATREYIDFDDQVCFRCKTVKAKEPVYHTEKLHLLCDACHEVLNKKAEKAASIDPANVVLASIWAVVAAIGGGLIWAFGWVIYDKVFVGVRAPLVVFAVGYLSIALLVAWPVATIFKKIPRRGFRLARFITLATCTLTAVLGEMFFTTFLCLTELGIFPTLGGIFYAWRLIVTESGSLYLLGKLISLGLLCALALDWSEVKISLEEKI